MEKRFLAVGGVLLIVGLFLTLAFWPIFGVSGSELAEDRDGLQYESYDEGDEVLVYGTITDIFSLDLGVISLTYVEIDDELVFSIHEEDDIDFSEGDSIYGRLTFGEVLADITPWELHGNLRSKILVDYLFYGITGIGLVIAIVGAVKD